MGDMVAAMRPYFDHLYSIELDEQLYRKAALRFSRFRKVHLIHGDSIREMEPIVRSLDQPALFWLDGHFSGGMTAKGNKLTPVEEELQAILGSRVKGHVIIIDDARYFKAGTGYPTLEAIAALVRAIRPESRLEIETDMIRISPATSPS